MSSQSAFSFINDETNFNNLRAAAFPDEDELAQALEKYTQLTRREQVIADFCEMSRIVQTFGFGADKQFNHAADCFCNMYDKPSREYDFQYSDSVIQFIRDAIAEKIVREEKKRLRNFRIIYGLVGKSTVYRTFIHAYTMQAALEIFEDCEPHKESNPAWQHDKQFILDHGQSMADAFDPENLREYYDLDPEKDYPLYISSISDFTTGMGEL